MAVKFTNNASALLAGAITDTATSLSVQSGTGALFPSISGADWFPLTVVAATGFEVMRCTARTGDVLTVVRGQEGTVARAFAAGDRAENRVTAAAITETLDRITAAETAIALGWSTGDMKYRPGNAAISGWVRVNGRTIGNAVSGATERANADCAALFEFVWNTFADAQCPVSGGRGGSGAADFAANKTITLSDLAGRAVFALDDAGAGAKSRLTNATATPNGTTPGATGGAQTRVLIEANLPAHTHTVGAGGDHNHGGATGSGGAHTHTGTADSGGAHTHTNSVSTTPNHDHGGATGLANFHSHGYTRYNTLVNITEGNETTENNIWQGTQTVQTDDESAHSHGIGLDGTHTHTVTINSGGAHTHTLTIDSGGAHTHVIAASGTHTHTLSSTGSGTAFDNQPAFLAAGIWYLKL